MLAILVWPIVGISPVVLEVAPSLLGQPVLLNSVTLNSRRFLFLDCIAVPVSVAVSEIALLSSGKAFGSDELSLGADSTLRDGDLFSGLIDYSSATTISIRFGRAIGADDHIVLVVVNATDDVWIRVTTADGGRSHIPLFISASVFGPVARGTEEARRVRFVGNGAPLATLVAIQSARAIALELSDFGAQAGGASGIIITPIPNLALTFVGLVSCPLAATTSSTTSEADLTTTTTTTTTTAVPATTTTMATTTMLLLTDGLAAATGSAETTAGTSATTEFDASSSVEQATDWAVIGAAAGCAALILLIAIVVGVVACRRRTSDVSPTLTTTTSPSQYGAAPVLADYAVGNVALTGTDYTSF